MQAGFNHLGPIFRALLVAVLAPPPVVATAFVDMESVTTGDHSPAPFTPSNALMFIENVGQWPVEARYLVPRALGGTLWLADDAIWVTLMEEVDDRSVRPVEQDPLARVDSNRSSPVHGVNLKITFAGANLQVRIEPSRRLSTMVSYFTGSGPDQWQPAVPVWGQIRYVDLLPGADLVLDSSPAFWRLEAHPGMAAPHTLRLKIEGAEGASLEGDRLRLVTVVGDIDLALPQSELPLQIEIAAPADALAVIHLPPSATARAQHSPELSPANNPDDLLYGTFLGGLGSDYTQANTVVRGSGIHISGTTGSSTFPTTPGAFATSLQDIDAFVVKLNLADSSLAYATFLGGSASDSGTDLALDDAGHAFVTGETQSTDFPTTAGAFGTSHRGRYDGFVVKLDPTGSDLDFAASLGGQGWDIPRSIAVDGAGSAYVTGLIRSDDFPATPGAFDTSYGGNQTWDAFVAKVNAAGSDLAYATYLGGGRLDAGNAVAVDAVGKAYVTGVTWGSFPTTPGAYDTWHGGWAGTEVFVTQLNQAGSDLVYSTYVGHSDIDAGFAVVVDPFGSAYVMGCTSSGNFPTTAIAFDRSHNGGPYGDDAFLLKLNPSGSDLVFSTNLGGNGQDWGNSLALDGAGNIYVVGGTWSDYFPTTPMALDRRLSGDRDGFLAKFRPNGSALLYATFLGGVYHDGGHGIDVDEDGNAYITGTTNSIRLSPGHTTCR